jgi:hypothetical protein
MVIGDLAHSILTAKADNPSTYPKTLDGLTAWLPPLRYFKPRELVYPVRAPRRGPRIVIPPRAWWFRLLRLGLLADAFRESAGQPCRIRYLYRWPRFNRQVHGAPQSDHLTAHGADIEVLGEGAAEAADHARSTLVWPLYKQHPELELSVGEGSTITHLGILSPRGRRWKY